MINEQLLSLLRVISPEEQAFLDGCIQIQRRLYMQAAWDVIDARKLLDTG